jgi:hypothetical protein
MRRLLTLTAVGLLFTLGACGNDDDSSTDTTVAETPIASETTVAPSETPSETSVAPETTVATAATDATDTTGGKIGSSDAPTIAKFIAQGIKDEAGEAITSDQADCMAKSMLDKLGATKLIEFGQSGGEFDSLPDADQAAIFETFSTCGDVLQQIIAAEIAKDGTVTKEQGLCVANGLIDEIGVQGLLALSKDSANIPAETQVKLVEALGKCLPPEVLATIGG